MNMVIFSKPIDDYIFLKKGSWIVYQKIILHFKYNFYILKQKKFIINCDSHINL